MAAPKVTRFTARTTPEIFEAVTRWCCYEKYPGQPCPLIPGDAAFAEWLPNCPQEARDEANTLLVQVIPDLDNLQWHDSTLWEFIGIIDRQGKGRLAAMGFLQGPYRIALDQIAWDDKRLRLGDDELSIDMPGGRVSWTLKIIELEDVQQAWLKVATPGSECLKHPLAPLVEAWRAGRPIEVKRDTKNNAIMPASFAIVRDFQSEQGELFDISSTSQTGFHAATSQGWLPTMEPKPPVIVPSLPLILYDAAGGKSIAQGRGAPLALRLWVESILSIPLAARSGVRRVVGTLEELIAQLWPKGWGGPGRDAPKLERAFDIIQQAYIPWDGGRWLAVLVRNRPNYCDLKSPVVFDVELPPGSGHGPLVHRPTLRKYGVTSASAYRLVLGLAYLWNKYLTHHGKRLPPTIPEVKRDSEGYVLNAQGKIATGKSGQAATHWNNSQAIRTGRLVRNPEMERLPWLQQNDLIRLGTSYWEFPRSRGTTRKALFDVHKAVRLMEESGDITVVESKDGWRIEPPDWWGDPTHKAEYPPTGNALPGK